MCKVDRICNRCRSRHSDLFLPCIAVPRHQEMLKNIELNSCCIAVLCCLVLLNMLMRPGQTVSWIRKVFPSGLCHKPVKNWQGIRCITLCSPTQSKESNWLKRELCWVDANWEFSFVDDEFLVAIQDQPRCGVGRGETGP